MTDEDALATKAVRHTLLYVGSVFLSQINSRHRLMLRYALGSV